MQILNSELLQNERDLVKSLFTYGKNTLESMKEIYDNSKKSSTPKVEKTNLNFQQEDSQPDYNKTINETDESGNVQPFTDKKSKLYKLKSRKFWLTLASVLASIGGAIAGIAGDNDGLAIAGMICTAVSTGLYSFINAYQKKFEDSTPSKGEE